LQAYAAQRVQAAQKKLNELNKKLKDKLAEAKKAERDSKKPKTAAEKSKDAREAKKYRKSHETELKTKAKAAAIPRREDPARRTARLRTALLV
jgi:hypothetical protein